MNIDSHLFLDKLEQMKELLSSPGIRSRANEPRLTKTIAEFYQLIDEYADKQSSDAESEDHSNELKSILNQLTSKIDVIEKHVDLNLNKLDYKLPFLLNVPFSKPFLHFSGNPSKLSNAYNFFTYLEKKLVEIPLKTPNSK